METLIIAGGEIQIDILEKYYKNHIRREYHCCR